LIVSESEPGSSQGQKRLRNNMHVLLDAAVKRSRVEFRSDGKGRCVFVVLDAWDQTGFPGKARIRSARQERVITLAGYSDAPQIPTPAPVG
jgi:hypothetical protein